MHLPTIRTTSHDEPTIHGITMTTANTSINIKTHPLTAMLGRTEKHLQALSFKNEDKFDFLQVTHHMMMSGWSAGKFPGPWSSKLRDDRLDIGLNNLEMTLVAHWYNTFQFYVEYECGAHPLRLHRTLQQTRGSVTTWPGILEIFTNEHITSQSSRQQPAH